MGQMKKHEKAYIRDLAPVNTICIPKLHSLIFFECRLQKTQQSLWRRLLKQSTTRCRGQKQSRIDKHTIRVSGISMSSEAKTRVVRTLYRSIFRFCKVYKIR